MSFFLLAWCVCTLGFIALAASMPRHQEQIFGKELGQPRSRVAAAAGWAMLGLGLAVCLPGGVLSNMVSYWVGVLTFSALAVVLWLSYMAHRLGSLAAVCAAMALPCLFAMAR